MAVDVQYIIDHDYLHLQLSLCSNDPAQTPGRMLQYAKEQGLTSLCLTDHFWDEAIPGALGRFYQKQTVPSRCSKKALMCLVCKRAINTAFPTSNKEQI